MYVKRVELCNFKSFGGTTSIPLLPGFTVISGPNGSGKSNILDALLFALGLSSSKGMRAERLPDLVNQNQTSRSRSTIEASVTVTFDISDELEALQSDEADDADGTGADHSRSDSTDPSSNEVAPSVSSTRQKNGQPASTTASTTAKTTAADSPQEADSGTPEPKNIQAEWTVTRRLRVTQQGTYTSNYYINSEPCTMTELHEQLQRLRIYPEGYNIVLQGDVTSIISMNPRERRTIIDELAGVASFDRKIDQAKDKLDQVKEREERFRIVEQELMTQRDRLAQDRVKAEKYKKLRTQLQEKSQWEGVLVWRSHQQRELRLQQELTAGRQTLANLSQQLSELAEAMQAAEQELEQLNGRVKALGEDEHIALQSALATREAELRQMQRQHQDVQIQQQDLTEQLEKTQQAIQDHAQRIETLGQEQRQTEQQRSESQTLRDQVQQQLEQQREAASAIAASSEAWVQEQTQLRHQIESLLNTLEPQRTEQARLQERIHQLRQKIAEQTDNLTQLSQVLDAKQAQHRHLQQTQLVGAEHAVQHAAQALNAAEQELQVQQETKTRLLQEQRDKQRQLDKLEAQTQAMQESQGTRATNVILETGLPGVRGLVAQLGRVDPRYQLALEIAAGGRLAYLVVEDDSVAAAAIELLKRKKAGRATFLPLNKIRPPRFSEVPAWQRPEGFIDYAQNLIDCEEDYRDVFAYVFGSTVVFESLEQARRHLGNYRIVTRQGDLLETSGAMTGGSLSARQGTLHFGRVEAAESADAIALRERLQVIDKILERCEAAILRASAAVKQQGQAMTEARQQHRELQLQVQQLEAQIQQLQQQQSQAQAQLQQDTQELTTAAQRLQTLEQTLPTQEADLQRQRQALAELEQSQTHSEWQQIQAEVRRLEVALSDRQIALRTAEQRLQDLSNQQQRLQERIQQGQQQIQDMRTQQAQHFNQIQDWKQQEQQMRERIAATRTAIAELDKTLASEKTQRDRAERQLRQQQTQQQQMQWQHQKLEESQQQRQQELTLLQEQLAAQRAELPQPLPEIPADLSLEQLQKELRSLQRRLEAMEPVNMLALEEYDRTQARLEDLTQKLTTLEEERTELLLRIENFTTLRRQAFREAFDAVNENFQQIFAELSDGDGNLELENPDDPFSGGLNLIAHPKGKPVRRLASMSGGEKSLTALSFIFALQRYRPSPFYSFDEVDMFLDGANVERLARMIKHQAQQAQFIVVSLRRPMIEASERTIGVTQARGAYTQVLGISLQAEHASV